MFAQDGALYRFGSWVVNLFLLNTLWVVSSLPLVTIGASTTATFRVAQQWVRGKDPSIWEEFWKSFRQNFVQATLIWLFISAIGVILLVNRRALFYTGSPGTLLYTLQIIALCELVLSVVYSLSLLARYHMKVGDCFRSAFLMTHRHLSTSVSILVLLLVMLWLSTRWPSLVLIAVSLFVWIVSFLQVNLFDRYEN